jgi:hypothetical protein
LQSLKLVIRRFTFSKQLVCKITEESYHWTSNWCRSEGMLRKALHELREKLILIMRPLEFELPTSTTVNTSGRTDATLNCSKLLDTNGHPDGKFSSSGRMMLWQKSVRTEYHVVRTDVADWWGSGRDTTSSGQLTGNRNKLLWKLHKIFLKNIAEKKTLDKAASLWKQQHYIEVILSNRMQPTQKLTSYL